MTAPHYRVEDYSIEESIGFLLNQVRIRIEDTMNNRLAATGISWPQWKVLIQLYYKRAQTAADLSRCNATDTGSMTRMIDRLEEKGFLRRVRSEADRRLVRLELTEAGQALMPTMLATVVDVLNGHLQGFSAEEVLLLKSFLRRMLGNAEPATPND